MKAIVIIPSLIIGAAVLVIAFALLPRLDRYLNIWAVQVCSNQSKFTKQDTSFTASYPIKDLYDACLSKTK